MNRIIFLGPYYHRPLPDEKIFLEFEITRKNAEGMPSASYPESHKVKGAHRGLGISLLGPNSEHSQLKIQSSYTQDIFDVRGTAFEYEILIIIGLLIHKG